ncbi:uncharacterized protein F4817DRAFT_308875 [Daldinia loculata]|uniref:uncharacterized protein n=1 Tax=Daldinia loculata TaxID=103429 RepID=UPI0020C1C8CC|nr:uncharacterized protein F4817DRAFT_308875 [Daldinia loculata]KAI1642191.1 hypothetical protein F4817DRAFT_308875 [Daldinia loculata]
MFHVPCSMSNVQCPMFQPEVFQVIYCTYAKPLLLVAFLTYYTLLLLLFPIPSTRKFAVGILQFFALVATRLLLYSSYLFHLLFVSFSSKLVFHLWFLWRPPIISKSHRSHFTVSCVTFVVGLWFENATPNEQ